MINYNFKKKHLIFSNFKTQIDMDFHYTLLVFLMLKFFISTIDKLFWNENFHIFK